MTDCDRCRELYGAAEAANAKCRELEQRVAELEAERAELQGQLAELTKLCELQQADLERYCRHRSGRVPFLPGSPGPGFQQGAGRV